MNRAEMLVAVREILKEPRISPTSDLIERGWNSLAAVELAARISDHLGQEVAFEALLPCRTVRSIHALVAQLRGTSDSPVSAARADLGGMVEITGAADAPRTVICMHEGSGRLTGYLALARLLSDGGIRVVGVLPPVDFNRSFLGEQVAPLIAYYRSIIDPLAAGDGVEVVGWSWGGLIATRVLADRSCPGDQLYLVDAQVPDSVRRRVGEMDMLIGEMSAARSTGDAEEWDALMRRMSSIVQVPVQFGMLPRGSAVEAAVRLRDSLSVNWVEWDGRYDGSCLHFTGVDSDRASRATEWLRVTPRAEVIEVAGDHMSLMRMPAVATVAARIIEGRSR